MEITLLKEGVFIMIIGMGTVFLFLTLMIGAMNFTNSILQYIGKYFPEEVPVEKAPAKKKAVSDDEEVALAIACAINRACKA